MVLLKHGDFEFQNILSGGYKILSNKPHVLSEMTMADGTIKRNYGEMPKTTIKVKFGNLDRETYRQYISHFQLPEDTYTFFNTDTGEMLTKKFFVTRPEDNLEYADDLEETHKEFEITLQQCGEA
ncbi:MAG: hypothetical protein IJ272_05530 [Clostridia bacterium]|nr:hypothetical protein [Clostridia bacterium]